MLNLLARHSFTAILLAVMLEEMGVPMPIPTDILIVLAGVEGTGSLSRLTLWFVALSCASACGASGLYMFVRQGGRPLVDRFGRYVHLGPEQISRGEALLQRSGWLGIAIGRAIPGLRYVTVIACGLLNVPYWRFITAHLVGSAVYILLFLTLGALFGPTVLSMFHTPSRTLHLVWLLMLAVGLPILIMWLSWRAHPQMPAEPSRRRLFLSGLLGSCLGAVVLAAAWSAAATIADFFGPARPMNVIALLVRWLLGRGLGAGPAYIAIYAVVLGLCIGITIAYYQFLLPRLGPRASSLPMQIAELGLLASSLATTFLMLTLVIFPFGPVVRWWQQGGVWLLAAVGVGIVGYAFTTAYGRVLAVAVLPSLRRIELGSTTRRTLEAELRHHIAIDVVPADNAPHEHRVAVATDESAHEEV